MASISSLMSSSSSSSIYGSRSSNIISGLASGMDTESMIEGMVQGIKSKIDKQKQQKTLLGWQQQAYRGISNQLINLSTKYMSYISNSNLMGSEVFGSSIITSLGTYADRISASGTTNSNIQITGATMATNASVTFDGIAGAQISDTISSGEIDLNGTTPVSNFAGKSITFEYDSRAITVNFPADAKYSSKEDVANEIKKQFDEQMKVAGMEGKVDISVSASGEIKFDNKGGGVFKVTAGSDKTLGALGLKADQDLSSGATVQVGDLDENVKNIDLLKGKTLSVTFGDKSTTLTIPDDAKDADSIINSLQSQIDKAFGYGRVDVSNTASNGTSGFKLQFDVKNTGGDTSNVFTITSGSPELMGKDGLLGFEYGASNRVNTNMTLGQLGNSIFSGLTPTGQDENGNDKYAFEINGVKIGEYTKNTKLSTILSDINSSDAGVNATYSQTANQFIFTSTYGGSGGKVEINGGLAGNIFGTPSKEVAGKDATLTATVNGKEMTLTSDTNTFDVDGMAITVNGEFKVDSSKNETAVTFNKKVDTDKIISNIKSFVEEYNKMLDDLGELYSTQPDNKYKPLTDDQKADMTDKQIEEYEKKAKEGMLFGDSDLKALASDLRFLFSDYALEEIGIKTSTEASDRGKLSIDENALRAALEKDPENVQNLLAGSVEKNDKGYVTGGGAISKLKEVIDEYAGTTGATKGILIEKAGSEFSATSMLKNELKTEMDDIDEMIEKLTDQLNDKIDFYTSKFSKLEVLISQMNSQSSYLAGMSGGY